MEDSRRATRTGDTSLAARLGAALVLLFGAAALPGPGCAAGSGEEAPAEEGDGPIGEAQDELNSAPVCRTIRRGLSGTVNDTFITNFVPSGNYGSNIHAYSQGNPIGKTLLKFSLGVVPPNATVTSANVTLTQTNGGAATVNVRQVTSSWSEGTVTWSTAPTLGAGTVTTFATSPAATVTFGIAPLVQQWVSGAQVNRGIELDQATTYTEYKTSETGTASQRPTLNFCYTVPCAAGMADCDQSNGTCEANLMTSSSNCGACGVSCSGGKSCFAGTCAYAPPPPAGTMTCAGNPSCGKSIYLGTLGACGEACGYQHLCIDPHEVSYSVCVNDPNNPNPHCNPGDILFAQIDNMCSGGCTSQLICITPTP
jgi:hypothetical protein